MNLADLVIPPWVRLAAVGALAAVLIGFGWWLGGLGPRADLADVQRDHAEKVAEWHRLAARGAQRALDITKQFQDAADAARMDLDVARAEKAALADRIAVPDARRMRVDLPAFAAGTGGTDTVAACRQRAAALAGLSAEGAELLAEGVGLLREAALAHDERSAEVRALLQAWPKNHAKVD